MRKCSSKESTQREGTLTTIYFQSLSYAIKYSQLFPVREPIGPEDALFCGAVELNSLAKSTGIYRLMFTQPAVARWSVGMPLKV